MTTKQAHLSNWRKQLLPHIVDHLAAITPEAPYALFPNSPVTYDEGYQTVTYKDFANAINGFAWWIKENLGESSNFEVLAYVGPNDLRYTALLLGAIKTGHVAFFTSPRNSMAANEALFGQLKCRTMLTPSPTPPMVESMLDSLPIKHLHVPSVQDLLAESHQHFPYDKTFDSARFEPLVVIHTSGSTGIPKPLIWTHETSAVHLNFITKEPPPGYKALYQMHQGKRILNTFPPFHGACLAVNLFNCVPCGTVSIAPLSGAIPTAEGIVQALKKAPADVAFLVPSIAADLSQNPDLLDYCSKNLEFIFFAGGDLPQAQGDLIASKVPIHCQYGASEIGLMCQLLPPEMTAADWRYVIFHPEFGLEFEEFSPGMFEMIVKRDVRYEEVQMPFTIWPSLHHLQAYRSRDLFEKHPTIPDCWGWRARADDIIVFLNGEKTNPVSMEHHITTVNEDVSAALVVGMQRFQAALLVEPVAKLGKLDQNEANAFIEKIWPSVDEANQLSPAHARVEKSMILLTAPEMPMVRSGKGTIQRQSTITQYTSELDSLYLKADTTFSGVERASVGIKSSEEVVKFIRQAVRKINPDLLNEGEDNFFALGMDSLMAMRLIRALRHGLGQPELSVSVVHNHPSVEQLTGFITTEKSMEGSSKDLVSTQSQEIQNLFEEYEQTLGSLAKQSMPLHPGNDEVVVLTGSTGSLGVRLLEALLANPDVSFVYCLNRRANAREIHQAKAKATGFPMDRHSHRVEFLQATLDQPHLGLEEATYKTLCSKATLIMHNAWPVNFILPLKNFRPHLNGLVNLFQLAAIGDQHPKLLYISSISSVGRILRSSTFDSVPEDVIRDFEAPYEIGYAKSKLLAELLCDVAAKKLHVPVSFARVGQIAGPVQSEAASPWSTSEWLPSLVMTSISLGTLPDDLGVELSKVDWMPVDLLARALVELGVARSKENNPQDSSTIDALITTADVFNVINPSVTSWKELLPTISSSIEKHAKKKINVITLSAWLDRLRQTAEDLPANTVDEVARTHPGIKLQEFYEQRMLKSNRAIDWDINRAIATSKTLRGMPAVGNEWVDRWVEGWVDELRRG